MEAVPIPEGAPAQGRPSTGRGAIRFDLIPIVIKAILT
jgi:hypothetical protein